MNVVTYKHVTNQVSNSITYLISIFITSNSATCKHNNLSISRPRPEEIIYQIVILDYTAGSASTLLLQRRRNLSIQARQVQNS